MLFHSYKAKNVIIQWWKNSVIDSFNPCKTLMSLSKLNCTSHRHDSNMCFREKRNIVLSYLESNPTSGRKKLRSFVGDDFFMLCPSMRTLDFLGRREGKGGGGWTLRYRVNRCSVLNHCARWHGYCLTICHPHSTFIALSRTFITSAQSDLAAG